MSRLKRVSIYLLFALQIFGSSSVSFAESTPDCDCDEKFDVGSIEHLQCEADGCSGVDVPVNGNLWVLAMAGFVFAFVKFGGHTKLVGYYYSKFEKRD